MKQVLTIDLDTRTASAGSSSWTPPPLTFGESLTLALSLQRTVDGQTLDQALNVTACRATVGQRDARPRGGKTSVKIGNGAQTSANTTAPLPATMSASDLAAAINALSGNTYGTAHVSFVDGSFLIIFGSGLAQVPISLANNTLYPLSFGDVGTWQRNGQWVHELRLIQLPLAFTDTSANVLPDAPAITEIQQGGSNGDVAWNEIQALYVPPDFKGTYQFKKGFALSGLLSVSDGPDNVQAALIAAFGSSFKVTNPLPATANIEFTGDFAGQAVPLMEIIAANAPQGDLTFTLNFSDAALKSALRAVPAVTVPLEVRVDYLDEHNVSREMVLFTILLTINRPLWWPSLATVPQIDWLQPPSPKDYIPFDPSQVITGQQYFRAIAGDGAAISFSIAHGLNTEDVFIFARENQSGGRQLVEGTDFTVIINSANQATVTAVGSAPALNAWAVYVMSAQTVAAFATGLVISMGQVTGLVDELTALGNAVTQLQTLLPGGLSVSNTTLNQGAFTIPIVPVTNATLFLPAGADPTHLTARAPFMLPAVHNATVTNTSTAPAPSAGAVWTNNSGGSLLIPGGGGIRSSNSPASGNIASDGRIAYPVRRSGTTISYYPVPFEQTLWSLFINDKMFPVGTTCTTLFSLAIQLINATRNAQYVIVIEQGVAARDVIGSPDTTDTNLQAITWAVDAPILRQQIILTPALITHTFGCSIIRASGGLSANALLYSQIVAANTAAPASANFALRARLVEFDTEDSDTTARGWVQYSTLQPKNGFFGASIS